MDLIAEIKNQHIILPLSLVLSKFVKYRLYCVRVNHENSEVDVDLGRYIDVMTLVDPSYDITGRIGLLKYSLYVDGVLYNTSTESIGTNSSVFLDMSGLTIYKPEGQDLIKEVYSKFESYRWCKADCVLHSIGVDNIGEYGLCIGYIANMELNPNQQETAMSTIFNNISVDDVLQQLNRLL